MGAGCLQKGPLQRPPGTWTEGEDLENPQHSSLMWWWDRAVVCSQNQELGLFLTSDTTSVDPASIASVC